VQFLLAVFFKQAPMILNQKFKCALRLVINVNLCMMAEHSLQGSPLGLTPLSKGVLGQEGNQSFQTKLFTLY
jgi:hypothetical protein